MGYIWKVNANIIQEKMTEISRLNEDANTSFKFAQRSMYVWYLMKRFGFPFDELFKHAHVDVILAPDRWFYSSDEEVESDRESNYCSQDDDSDI